MSTPDLSAVSAFDVARLAAAAAFGWGLVSALWRAVSGAAMAGITEATRQNIAAIRVTVSDAARRSDDDDKTPPGPPAAA